MAESTRPVRELAARVDALGESFGGALCLDFANSVEPRGDTAADGAGTPRLRQDFNDGYDLVAWGLRQQLYGNEQAERLWRLAGDRRRADPVLRRTRVLSDLTYRIFGALADGRRPDASDLGELQQAYGEAVRTGTMSITPTGPAFDWPEPDLRIVPRAAAVSAFDTLRAVGSSKIKICPGAGRDGIPCGWLFIDSTKNGSRRWCSMSDCGNASKSRRQNDRRRTRRSDHRFT
ncbi:CGNR zinc finger domain-containing protein [Microlunatus speluncae]|uniref:CGNR zinc finger domain-containing protein n=1 Tax=Microlunatus speluncae TaxID=2594267 RepID=UPI001C2CD4CB|nr:CGNR zinc finger domain-containing protein [Microlunatus speluncae]